MNNVGRFAPSPTGRMHLGNIYSALLSWLSAKQQGGEWILRIEDLDPQRSRMAYALQAEDDLRWLGLTWDKGGTGAPQARNDQFVNDQLGNHPASENNLQIYHSRGSAEQIVEPLANKKLSNLQIPEGSFVQSERGAIYEHYLRVLEERGLTYPCYCTRADIMATQAPHESDGRVVYKGTCRTSILPDGHPSSKEGRNPSTRLMVPDRDIRFTDQHYGPQTVNLASHCGDFVVRRADGAWAYQLAVVVDDALMGVTEVVRGRDLLLSSAQQIYLYELLGFPVPRFCHLPLLVNEAGQRLSKRDKSLDMGCLRERFSPEELIGFLAHAAGQISRPEPISLGELLPIFSWDKVPTDDVLVQL